MSESVSASLPPEPYFFRRCIICGYEVRVPWGPEVHAESGYALTNHVLSHSESTLADYARREALRGV